MKLQTALLNRRSIRKYKSTPVEREKLDQIVEIGRISHSALNHQPWHFTVVDDPELISKIEESFVYDTNKGAPALIVTFGLRESSKMTNGLTRSIVDTSIATSYMQLKALDLGLGTCWLGAFDREVVEKALGAPEHLQAMHVTTIGYPNQSPKMRPRKSIEEVTNYNRF